MKNSKWKLTQRVASNIIVVFAGVAFFLALSNFDAVKGQLASWVRIIAPFIWGLALAYLLDGPVRFFEKKFHGHRGFAIVLACVLAVIVVSFLIGMVVPQVVESLMMLLNRVPEYMENLNQFIKSSNINLDGAEELIGSYQELLTRVTGLISAMLPKVVGYGMAIGSGLVSAITAVISSIYMLMSKDKLLRQLKKVVLAAFPLPRARRVLEECHHANQVFSGFINGKLIDSTIIGIICFVGMSLFRMPFAVLISVIVGVTNIIPFFGPFIGAIPSILILLIINPWDALGFAVFVLALQQFDGNILGPKILGDSTGLSAFWVLVAIIVGGGLFGFVGMVVGVPAFAVLYSLTSDILARRLAEKGIDAEGRPVKKEPTPPEAEE
ncbi:MAG: AI-2E family transporter [Oscillospiraceae bacterium]|nr:AI-2E family transporter [Oscillospiraceae bacterium]